MNVRSMIIFAIYVTSICINVTDFETFNSLPPLLFSFDTSLPY